MVASALRVELETRCKVGILLCGMAVGEVRLGSLNSVITFVLAVKLLIILKLYRREI